jgi:hypothetical protein
MVAMNSVKNHIESPRERAAKALGRLAGYPEGMLFNERPVWQSLLADSDSILEAALEPDQWQRMKATGPPDDIGLDLIFS